MRLIILHCYFTSPTKEDRVPKLATASSCIHGSRGPFCCLLLPLTTLPFVRVYRFSTVILADPGMMPSISLPVWPTSSSSQISNSWSCTLWILSLNLTRKLTLTLTLTLYPLCDLIFISPKSVLFPQKSVKKNEQGLSRLRKRK